MHTIEEKNVFRVRFKGAVSRDFPWIFLYEWNPPRSLSSRLKGVLQINLFSRAYQQNKGLELKTQISSQKQNYVFASFCVRPLIESLQYRYRYTVYSTICTIHKIKKYRTTCDTAPSRPSPYSFIQEQNEETS